VQSTPSLWANITIKYFVSDEKDDEELDKSAHATLARKKRVKSLILMYVERSVDAPLYVDIAADGVSYLRGPDMQAIMANSRRWREFSLSLERPLEGSFFKPVAGNIPMLEHVKIKLEDNLIGDLDAFSELHPALVSWTYSGSRHIHDDKINDVLPCSQITTLNFPYCHLAEASRLSSLQHLQSLTLSISFCIFEDEDTVSPFVLASLRSLSLTFSCCGDGMDKAFECICLCFRTPGLEELTINPENMTDVWQSFHFKHFLAASGCQLNRLVLLNTPMEAEDFIATLQLMPHLKSLSVEETSIDETEYDLITLESVKAFASSSFLPHLRELKLVVESCPDAEVGLEIADMVAQRADRGLNNFLLQFREDEFWAFAPYRIWKCLDTPKFHAEVSARDLDPDKFVCSCHLHQ
jgi:hypothetical protein